MYQIKVHILMMSSINPRWLPVYKHWYIFYTIQSSGKYYQKFGNLTLAGFGFKNLHEVTIAM